jgi:hypothetical protein
VKRREIYLVSTNWCPPWCSLLQCLPPSIHLIGITRYCRSISFHLSVCLIKVISLACLNPEFLIHSIQLFIVWQKNLAQRDILFLMDIHGHFSLPFPSLMISLTGLCVCVTAARSAAESEWGRRCAAVACACGSGG